MGFGKVCNGLHLLLGGLQQLYPGKIIMDDKCIT